MKFFSFWRSLASFRVRIALNLKKLPAEVVFVDLDADAHRAEEYRRLNPQMALPSLVLDDGTVLFQSLAILEYLEETHPTPALPLLKGREFSGSPLLTKEGVGGGGFLGASILGGAGAGRWRRRFRLPERFRHPL